jgi:hypothetical protein
MVYTSTTRVYEFASMGKEQANKPDRRALASNRNQLKL